MKKTLGELVSQAMMRKGLKGYELGEALGKPPSYVSRLINDEIKEVLPPPDVAALERVLGLSQADMLRALGYDIREAEGVGYPEGTYHAVVLRQLATLTDVGARNTAAFIQVMTTGEFGDVSLGGDGLGRVDEGVDEIDGGHALSG